MAKANEDKSGDHLAGIAAADAQERVAAKACLSRLTLHDLYENPAVPYEEGSTGASTGRFKTGRSPSCANGCSRSPPPGRTSPASGRA